MNHNPRDYKDYAANERNYLAWIRTGITLIGLGFVLEKFEFFIASLSLEWLSQATSSNAFWGSSYAGIALVMFGICIILLGSYRFIRVKHALDTEDPYMFRGLPGPLAVAFVIIGFAVYLMFYLIQLIQGS